VKPILFWVIGSISIFACLLAIGHRKPLRCTQGLVALLLSNAVLLFLLSAPLLAIELIVVTLGASSVVWIVLVRPGRMKLGTPGRTRYNITKVISLFITLWLSTVLILTVFRAREPGSPEPTSFVPAAELGAVLAMFILGIAATTAYLVVVTRRRQDEEGEQS